MILVAESGSTKTEWRVSDGAFSSSLHTDGLNPLFGGTEGIVQEVSAWIDEVVRKENVDAFFFYGAGVLSAAATERLTALFSPVLPCARMEFASDLVAAARATCGDSAGIVAVLGTGTNSCFWNGRENELHTPALGYVLGDEGGGAYIGRRLLSDYLKGVMPRPVACRFEAKYGVTEAEAVRRVYAEPYPNRYLAGFARFAAENIAMPYVSELVEEGFARFVKRNLHPYPTDSYPVNFVGSVAAAFTPQLEKVCRSCSVVTGKIIASPVEELLEYHAGKAYGPTPAAR